MPRYRKHLFRRGHRRSGLRSATRWISPTGIDECSFSAHPINHDCGEHLMMREICRRGTFRCAKFGGTARDSAPGDPYPSWLTIEWWGAWRKGRSHYCDQPKAENGVSVRALNSRSGFEQCFGSTPSKSEMLRCRAGSGGRDP